MTEQIRASHIPKAPGAYDELLQLPEVAARSNASKRERYLYAITALKDHGGWRPLRAPPATRPRSLRYRLPRTARCTSVRY